MRSFGIERGRPCLGEVSAVLFVDEKYRTLINIAY